MLLEIRDCLTYGTTGVSMVSGMIYTGFVAWYTSPERGMGWNEKHIKTTGVYPIESGGKEQRADRQNPPYQ